MLFLPQIFSGVDRFVSAFASREKYFRDGLGDREFLAQAPDLHARDVGPAILEWLEDPRSADDDQIVRRKAQFISPAHWLPESSRTAYVETVFPKNINRQTPIFVHFAATGDETYIARNFLLADRLARQGIASLVLMNPYYGKRRPASQRSFAPPTVSDQMRMNSATIFEGVALVRWLLEQGYENPGVTGVSMGGSMAASVVAQMYDVPLRAAICIGPVGPAPAFSRGTLADQVDWQALRRDYGLAPDAPESQVRSRLAETLDFADLRHFARPARPDLAVLIGARHDAYVPADSVQALHDHWVGSRLRWLEAGHVSAVLLHMAEFRRAIMDVARPAANSST